MIDSKDLKKFYKNYSIDYYVTFPQFIYDLGTKLHETGPITKTNIENRVLKLLGLYKSMKEKPK